jgi:uncharacterized protein (TIGR02117 family)
MCRLAAMLILVTLLAGCMGPIKELYPDNPEQRTVTVYIINHGFHADIAIERSVIDHLLPHHEKIPRSHWLKFGWGDSKYYTTPEPGLWLAIRAVLLPTTSVLHIVGFDMPAEDYFPRARIIKVQVTREGAEAMGRFIAARFQLDKHGHPRYRTEGLYNNSAFFEATGRYHLPKTSNTWTACALRRTGYPVTPFYALTVGNLMLQASRDGVVIQ